jgi:integrase
VWRVDVEVHRDPVTGQRRRVSRRIDGTREQAEIALARLKVADHERRLPSGGTRARSVKAAFQLYEQAVESGLIELAPSTLSTVRSAAKLMGSTTLPDGRAFGDVRLSRLNWQDIEHVYNALRASGRSAAWVRRCATVLTRALELARKRGFLDANPAKDAARPRSSRTKPFSPPAQEVRQLLERAAKRDPELADAVTVLLSTGMRKGELLALRWVDVDLDLEEVHVAASVSDGGPGVGVVRRPTKTADWRDVPLTAAAAQALQRQHGRRKELTDADPRAGDYVFPGGRDGSVPSRPESLANRWVATRGRSPVTLLHLRHYAATAMLDAGESYRTVADILGNSEATLRLHYDGRTDVGKRRAITALELDPAG